MKDLWAVEFTLMMNDVICSDAPVIYGKIHVRAHNIFDALGEAKSRLSVYGYDRLIIDGARRCDPEKTKGETENE